MAYRPLATTSLLIFFFCFSAFSTTSNSSTASIILPSDSQKVSLGLYYESLCPYSANFIINYLVKLFETDLISVVDLNLVPWGNAKIRGNDTFDCQHGPYECLLNTVEACAIHIWPELGEHFPFINCVETLVYERKYPQWESCFDKLGLDPKPITDCYSSGYGKERVYWTKGLRTRVSYTELELQYAAETDALEPPHKYVPWVVVDGEPLYEDYENFISYICNAYKGVALPKACSKVNIIQGEKTNPTHPVCFGTIILALAARIKSAITSWMRQMNTVVSI